MESKKKAAIFLSSALALTSLSFPGRIINTSVTGSINADAAVLTLENDLSSADTGLSKTTATTSSKTTKKTTTSKTTTTTTTQAPVEEPLIDPFVPTTWQFMRADVDRDAQITYNDLGMIQEFITSGKYLTSTEMTFDVNGNGISDSRDLAALYEYKSMPRDINAYADSLTPYDKAPELVDAESKANINHDMLPGGPITLPVEVSSENPLTYLYLTFSTTSGIEITDFSVINKNNEESKYKPEGRLDSYFVYDHDGIDRILLNCKVSDDAPFGTENVNVSIIEAGNIIWDATEDQSVRPGLGFDVTVFDPSEPISTTTTTTTTAKTSATATTTTKTTTTKTTTTNTVPEPVDMPSRGDVNGDKLINAVDASKILVLYAGLSANEVQITDSDIFLCDINNDKIINAVDASLVLAYYANLAQTPDLTLDAFLYDLAVKENAKNFNPEVPERKELNENGSFCGIAYVGNAGTGYINPEEYNAAYIETVIWSGVADKFDFYWNIPKENYVETAQGTEIYLVIPTDPEAHVTVTQYDIENGKEGEALYRNTCGAPFVLICNYSDITSDVRISITDNAGTHETFYPYISMKDGEPAASSANVTVFELVSTLPE